MAKALIFLGAILIVIGLFWYFFPGALSWFGRLPGDIRIEGQNGSFYFPIVSMIVVSLVLTALLNLLQRLF